jgi:hypothetical protein
MIKIVVLHKHIELTIILQWQNPYKNLCRLCGGLYFTTIIPWIFLRWSHLTQQISVFQHLIIKFSHSMTQFCLTTNVALIVLTLNLDFYFDHTVFITQNILSTGAVLPGRQRINSTILQMSWKSRRFSLISERKNVYPSIKYKSVFFIPYIQLPHNYTTFVPSLHSLSSLINFNTFWRSSLKLQFRLFDIAKDRLKALKKKKDLKF